MLRLKRIEITGFKSFDKKNVLEFSAPITSVVGPNGSGKSNVVEAFRFVLGEQSLRSMRGRKGYDLIFNGGKSGKRANRASVKIVFANDDRFFDVDYNDVSVERVVFRDGVNEYLINDSQVRLRDLVEFFAKANIASSGNHIISQGEADWVLNASPKDRREIVEDGLGLRLLQYRREQSKRKLKRTKDHIAEVESLRRELMPHLRFLKRQVEKVEQAKELRKNIYDCYMEYLYRESVYLSHNEKKIGDELSETKRELDKLEGSISEISSKTKAADERTENTEMLSELSGSIKKVREEKERATLELGRIEGEMRAQMALVSQKGGEAGGEPVPRSEIKKVIASADDVYRQSEGLESVAELKEIVGRLVEMVRGLLKVSADDEGRSKLLIEELEGRKKECVAELESIGGREKDLQEKINLLSKKKESTQTEMRDAEREMFALMNEQTKLNGRYDRLFESQKKISVERADFQREYNEAEVLMGKEIGGYVSADVGVSDDEVVGEARERQVERRRDIEKVKIRIEEIGTGIDDGTVREYEETMKRDEHLTKELSDLNESIDSLEKLIEELTKEIDKNFRDGIKAINKGFDLFFKTLFGGGSASVSLVKLQSARKEIIDEHGNEIKVDAGEGDGDGGGDNYGIDINVALPQKKIKSLEVLSGGERALTSIALLFAMSQITPPPFLILDETDAALDEANSRRYGDMINELSKHSQLVLVTHNRETMSRADILYGVTMGEEGVSQLLSVRLEEAVQVAK